MKFRRVSLAVLAINTAWAQQSDVFDPYYGHSRPRIVSRDCTKRPADRNAAASAAMSQSLPTGIAGAEAAATCGLTVGDICCCSSISIPTPEAGVRAWLGVWLAC